MKNKIHLSKWCAAPILGLAITASAQAEVVSLEPMNQTILVGQQATFGLFMEFADNMATLGGGIDVFFDAQGLRFDSYVAEDFGEAFARRDPDTNVAGELNGIAFGSFSGLSGRNLVGTLTFTGLIDRNTPYELMLAANDTPAGGFRAVAGGPQDVTFNSATITVAPIPLPAAVWMMVGGIGLLAARFTRKGDA